MNPIVVVGGGIVGTSVAYSLRTADRPVYLFEKNALGSGTTGGSIAQFTYHQDDPDEHDHELRRRAWEWLQPRIEDGRFSFEQCGTLHTFESDCERAAVEHIQSGLSAFGAETEWLDAADLARYDLVTDELGGGLLFPTDGVLDPSEIVHYQAERVRETGGRVETGVEVTDVATDDGAVAGVELGDGETVAADYVVNAAGPWAPLVDGMVGVDVPLRHTGGPIVVLDAGREVRLPLTFFEDGLYFREEGATRLLVGNFATGYDEAERLDPEGVRTPAESFRLDVADAVGRYLPSSGDVTVVNEWFDLRTVTPDSRPIVDETRVDGYVVATGMSGYGVTASAAVGDLVADLVAGRESALLDAFSLDRFA
ncbi:MAG: NAD(P)/FAD-dependent oxidoreductase [Haloarculaceae archaeon]